MTQSLEDLSALSRRGQLSAAERSQLDALLNDSPEERFWHLAGCTFDAEEVAQATDVAAAERVLTRLAQVQPSPRKLVPRRRAPVWLIAVAAALVVAGAAAAVVSVQGAHEVPSAPSGGHAAVSRRLRADAPATVPVPAVPAPALPELMPSAAPSPASVASSTLARSTVVAPFTNRSAAELLSDAGRARRDGYAAPSIALLESLQARFPSSAEAVASDIMLGSLRLQSGSAVAALQHYDRYLRRLPSGSLAPEAIWGRAQALSRLGHSAEARKSLSDLVQGYPSSPYASSAKAKLRALDRGH